MIEQGMAGVGARQRLHIEKLKKELEQEKKARISDRLQSINHHERLEKERSEGEDAHRQLQEKKHAEEQAKYAAELEARQDEITVLKSCAALLEKAKTEAEEKASRLEAELKQQSQKCKELNVARSKAVYAANKSEAKVADLAGTVGMYEQAGLQLWQEEREPGGGERA